MGKDQIEPSEQIIRLMEGYNVDPVQARTYIINNRHNHTTALYYLLEIKLAREGKLQTPGLPTSSVLSSVNASKIKPVENNFIKPPETPSEAKRQPQSPKKDEKKREGSPLIYRPEKKP